MSYHDRRGSKGAREGLFTRKIEQTLLKLYCNFTKKNGISQTFWPQNQADTPWNSYFEEYLILQNIFFKFDSRNSSGSSSNYIYLKLVEIYILLYLKRIN